MQRVAIARFRPRHRVIPTKEDPAGPYRVIPTKEDQAGHYRVIPTNLQEESRRPGDGVSAAPR